jgi:diguanylate cyclase (GGDEF)-like protein
VKVKIYNLDGMTVFSTEESQIGEDQSSNAGFQSARRGVVASRLTHRDMFNAFDKVIEDRDVIASYVPIRRGGADAPIEGVFEVYEDVTPLVRHIEETQVKVVLFVILILAFLYGALYFIIWRADRIIRRHALERSQAEAALQKARDELEMKVQERTKELQETASRLMVELAERKKAEERLVHHALHDMLTGLPNRTLFMDRLERALEHARRRNDYLFAVMVLDLDHFKVINESLGHSAGDRLLTDLSRRLASRLRSSDTLARLGGDEFAILLDDIPDISETTRVAERILKETAAPFILNGQEIFTSASIGVALSNSRYQVAEDLLRDADTAMYRAKSEGRARYQIFNKTMHAAAIKRIQVESDLRRALEKGELVVYFQPIYSLKDLHLIGFEALVRWRHTTRGLLLPGEFIPIAEENGLIKELDLYVMRQACHQIQEWQTRFSVQPPLDISVNLSGKLFKESGLAEQVVAIIKETRLDPSNLIVEITENVLVDNTENTASILAQLRDYGVKVNLDDFGTGYSSLMYLQRFQFDCIKIDHSFIQKMRKENEAHKIVRSVVRMARDLRMGVIAEGVETTEHLECLREMECDYAQGFLFSPPVDRQSAEALLVRMADKIALEV